MARSSKRTWTAAAAALALAGCLPDDTRPAPGTAVLRITADESLTTGLLTDDGWQVAYERFWLSLGEVRLLGDECEPYAESDYLRVLDLRVAGPQTVNTMHARGRCELGFQVRSPTESSVLGAGVSEEDRAFMREVASDPFVEDAGIALHVAGSATREQTTRRFEWSFRQRLDYLCNVVSFQSGSKQALEIALHGDALFRPRGGDSDAAASPGAELGFDGFAAADENDDGEITLAELERSLAAELYLERVPELLRFEQKRCFVAPLQEE
jgi:hypothetical protein